MNRFKPKIFLLMAYFYAIGSVIGVLLRLLKYGDFLWPLDLYLGSWKIHMGYLACCLIICAIIYFNLRNRIIDYVKGYMLFHLVVTVLLISCALLSVLNLFAIDVLNRLEFRKEIQVVLIISLALVVVHSILLKKVFHRYSHNPTE